jgi:hypothetical protein
VVTVYAIGRNRSERLASYYQQQVRYIQLRNLRTTPRQLLEDDLLQQLRVWRASGERIILMMDANENITTGRLCRQLGNDDIELQNSTLLRHGKLPTNTHADGSEPIDGLWHTPDVEITEVKWLSFEESPGDHRACVFEFTTHSVIGNFEQRIVYPPCRRLNTKIRGVVERYGKLAEAQFAVHRISERLDRLELIMGHSYPPSPEHQRAMEILDKQVVEIQRHCENKCRKIYRADLAFSAPVKLWHERVQVYTKLLRLHEGKIRNVGNLCRLARKRGIKRPKQLTVEEITKRRAYAKARKRELRRTAPALRREHLRNLLLAAEANGYADKAADIRAIMDREGMKRMWWTIRHAMNDKSGKSVTRVERVVDGRTEEYTSEDEVITAIQEETEVRFHLANSAPICQGLLAEQLGLLADTETAQRILDGTFKAGPEINDATTLLLQEIGRLGCMLTNGEVIIEITADEFQEYWRRAREATSSSYSGIHFGHYKAAGQSEFLSSFFAKKISLIARTGCPPHRWGVGLTVMLEKIAGIALVNKLRAILLMEADFNMHNRIIFGSRMIQRAREEGTIPEELFSSEGNTAEDGTFQKKVTFDISRQTKSACAVTSNDAASCYDRIAHAIASLIFQAYGVSTSACRAMLLPISIMTFYLRTGFGESTSFMGGILIPKHKACAKVIRHRRPVGKLCALQCYAATNCGATDPSWSARFCSHPRN